MICVSSVTCYFYAGKKAIEELMDAVDTTIPTPERSLEEPFLLPVESVHSIPGRGTVITGRAQRGKVKIGSDLEIIGHGKTAKTKVSGIETFHKDHGYCHCW